MLNRFRNIVAKTMGNTHERRNKENYDPDVVVSTSPPLLFHATHSSSLQLSLTRRLVKRFAGCKGICFTNRPIEIGERVYIRIVESSNSWKGALRFGYTCEDPSYINAADLSKFIYPDLTSEQGYWAKTVPASALRQGYTLFFYIAEDGSVIYGVNDEEKGTLFAGVRTDILLWALMDVYGNTTAIELVDVLQQSSTSLNSGSSNSSFEQQPPPAIPKSIRICAESRAASLPPPRVSKRRNASPPPPSTVLPTDSSPPLQHNSNSHGRSSLKTSTRRQPSIERNANDALPQSSDDSATLTIQGRSSERRIVEEIKPMPFHQMIGRNITLSADQRIATRRQGEYCNGYVFTSRPLLPGERVHFSVLVINKDFVGGLAFGVTACNPATLKLGELIDDSDLLLDRPEYWVVRKDVYTNPAVGDELCFHLTEKGEIRYSRNRHHNGTLMHVDGSLPLWAFVDVYGSTQQIQFLGVSKKTKNRHTDRQQSCPANPSAQLSNPTGLAGQPSHSSGAMAQLQSALRTVDLSSPQSSTTTSHSIQTNTSAFHAVSSATPTNSRFIPHEHAELNPVAASSRLLPLSASTVTDMLITTTSTRSNHVSRSGEPVRSVPPTPPVRASPGFQSNHVNSSNPSSSSATARSNFTDGSSIGVEPVVPTSNSGTDQALVLNANCSASIHSPIPPPIPARAGRNTNVTSASLTPIPTTAPPATSNSGAPDLQRLSSSESSRRRGRRIEIDPVSLSAESPGGDGQRGASVAPSHAAVTPSHAGSADLRGHAFLGGNLQTVTTTMTTNSPVVLVADRRHSSVVNNSADLDLPTLPRGHHHHHHRKHQGGRPLNDDERRASSKYAPIYAQTALRSAERYAQQSSRTSRFGAMFEDNLSSLPPPLIPVPQPTGVTTSVGVSINSPAVVSHRNRSSVESPELRNEVNSSGTASYSSNLPQNAILSSTTQFVASPEESRSGVDHLRSGLLNVTEPAAQAVMSNSASSSGVTTPSSPGYSASECAICLERPADSALYTCGHMCTCYTCAQEIMRGPNPLCPICRFPIRDVIKIFRS